MVGREGASPAGTREGGWERVASWACTWGRVSVGSCTRQGTPPAWGRDTVTLAPGKEACGVSSGTDTEGEAGAPGVGGTSMLPR